MSQWVEGTVVSQKQWTETLFSIYIDAPILAFEAGQFTQLSLMPHQPHQVFRPYSYVNAPDEKLIEFYYNVVPKGQFSTQLAALQPNDGVWLNAKAAGFFVMSIIEAKDTLWLCATGTALGVFLSLLKTQAPWDKFKQVVLIHSVHNQESLTHQDVLEKVQERYHDRFHYMPIVTRDKTRQIYGERITVGLQSGEIERLVQLPLTAENSHVMLCGNPAMLKECTEILKARGLTLNRHRTPGHITLENYWK